MAIEFRTHDAAGGGVSVSETTRCIQSNRATIASAVAATAYADGPIGWFSIDRSAPLTTVTTILKLAETVRRKADTLIVIGIGGSNRGAVAAINALQRRLSSPVTVLFAGDTLSGSSLEKALHAVRTRSVMLNVIAKDFNTVEPGITFRILRQALQERYGDAYRERVIATGSRSEGQLHPLAMHHGWHFLDFPSDIGGRYSVLSAVGLLPMAVAGVDIEAMLEGARAMERQLKATVLEDNPAVRYAVARRLLVDKGCAIESLVVHEPDLTALARWWVQLFGESEGKTEGVLFPTFFSYSEDLHAIGQFVQQGPKTIVETYLKLFHAPSSIVVKHSHDVRDNFDYMDGKAFDALNQAVYRAALEAHRNDGRPCLELECRSHIDASTLGALFYFFMFSVSISASLLKVNPFDQPGVELYKGNLYAALGKQAAVQHGAGCTAPFGGA